MKHLSPVEALLMKHLSLVEAILMKHLSLVETQFEVEHLDQLTHFFVVVNH